VSIIAFPRDDSPDEAFSKKFYHRTAAWRQKMSLLSRKDVLFLILPSFSTDAAPAEEKQTRETADERR